MKYNPTFKPGDRVGYSAKFLRSIGADHDTASVRGTFVKWRNDVEKRESFMDMMCFVRWDDEDLRLDDWADDPEYQQHIRDNGQMVNAQNIAKVATVAFCDPHAYGN